MARSAVRELQLDHDVPHLFDMEQQHALVGKQFTYRLVSPMIGPQTFAVFASEDGVNASVEVCDVHGTVTAVSTLGPIYPEQE